jgi:hypothetical protein
MASLENRYSQTAEQPSLNDEQQAAFKAHLNAMKVATPEAIKQLVDDVQSGNKTLENVTEDAATQPEHSHETPGDMSREEQDLQQARATAELMQKMNITQKTVNAFDPKRLALLTDKLNHMQEGGFLTVQEMKEIQTLKTIHEGLEAGLLKQTVSEVSSETTEQSTTPEMALQHFLGATTETDLEGQAALYIAVSRGITPMNAAAIIEAYQQQAARDITNGLTLEQLKESTGSPKIAQELLDLIADGKSPEAVNDAFYELVA